MRSTVCVVLAIGLLALVTRAGEETPVEHAKSSALTSGEKLGTREYAPLEREKPFYDRLSPSERKSGGLFSDYVITGKKGTYVGWFGIVREVKESSTQDRTDLLVEMKYFDGLTDHHQQIVSFTGGGDFRAWISAKGLGIKHLSLVRVYGTVTREDDEGEHRVPVLEAKFVVHWDWGGFAFMNYGEARGNQEWRKACRVKISAIYHPNPPDRYYEQRLGSREATGQEGEVGALPGASMEELLDLSRHTFRALKANDPAILDRFLPTAADVTWAAAQAKEHGAEDVDEAAEKQGGAEAAAVKAAQTLLKDFAEARKLSAEDFAWAEAEFGGLDQEATSIEREIGILTGDVTFLVVAKGARHRIRLRSCGRVGRGWIVTRGMRYESAAD